MSSADLNLTGAGWVKSSHSGPEGGQCVECRPSAARVGAIPVRDSKHPDSPILAFSVSGWTDFVQALKEGHFTN